MNHNQPVNTKSAEMPVNLTSKPCFGASGPEEFGRRR